MPGYIYKDEALKKVSWDTEAYQSINMIPPVDAVEVVRCKDCWKRNYENFCPLVSDNCYPITLPDDWFCKDGERSDI